MNITGVTANYVKLHKLYAGSGKDFLKVHRRCSDLLLCPVCMSWNKKLTHLYVVQKHTFMKPIFDYFTPFLEEKFPRENKFFFEDMVASWS